MSLLDPRSSSLQCGDQTPGTVSSSATAPAKGCSQTAFVPEASSPFPLCSWGVLIARQVPWLPSAGGSRWRALLQCQWVSLTKPLLARAGKQTLLQPCAMLPDDSLQLASHSLGNAEGSQGADQHPADTVSLCIILAFQVSLCPYLRGVRENLSE